MKRNDRQIVEHIVNESKFEHTTETYDREETEIRNLMRWLKLHLTVVLILWISTQRIAFVLSIQNNQRKESKLTKFMNLNP